MRKFTVAFLAVSLLVSLCQPPVAVAEEAVAIQSGVQSIDLPLSQADLIRLEIKDGFFDEYSVDHMSLDMRNVNLRDGNLNELDMSVKGGEFDYVFLDSLTLKTAPFSFDTFELLNHQRFSLDHPVNGSVSVTLTEEGLNRFIQEPKVKEKLERGIQKKTGGLKLITFDNPKVELRHNDEVRLSVLLTVGGGLQMPVDMQGRMKLKNGNLNFSDLSIVATDGAVVPLPVDVAQLFEDQLNDMLRFDKLIKKNLVITGDSLKLSTKKIEIDGHATMTKLEFGKRKKS